MPTGHFRNISFGSRGFKGGSGLPGSPNLELGTPELGRKTVYAVLVPQDFKYTEFKFHTKRIAPSATFLSSSPPAYMAIGGPKPIFRPNSNFHTKCKDFDLIV